MTKTSENNNKDVVNFCYKCNLISRTAVICNNLLTLHSSNWEPLISYPKDIQVQQNALKVNLNWPNHVPKKKEEEKYIVQVHCEDIWFERDFYDWLS